MKIIIQGRFRQEGPFRKCVRRFQRWVRQCMSQKELLKISINVVWSYFTFPAIKLAIEKMIFQVSMAKERKRLINEDLVQEVPHPHTSARPGRDNPAQDDIRGKVVQGNQIVVDESNRPDLLNQTSQLVSVIDQRFVNITMQY